MFIRQRSNSHKKPIQKKVKQEVVPQEQPLEEPADVAEVAAQKVEEVMRMVPVSIALEEVEAFLNEEADTCEECAVESAQEMAEEADEVSSSDEPDDGDITE